MAVNKDLPSERGRPFSGRRGLQGFSSLRALSSSRERSPHFSPDRIRHGSPSRYSSLFDSQEIVPRIPQPYRTSFSAVTSPKRIVHKPSAESGSNLLNNSRLSRSTPIPVITSRRITSPERYSGIQHFHVKSSRVPTTPRNITSLSHSRILDITMSSSSNSSKHDVRANQSLDNLDDHKGQGHSRSTSGGQTHDESYTDGSLDNTFDSVDGILANSNIPALLANGDLAVREFMNGSTANGSIPAVQTADGGQGQTQSTVIPTPLLAGEVSVATIKQKEFVDVQDIKYFKGADVNDRKSFIKFRKKKAAVDDKTKKAGSAPGTPNESPKGRQGRSSTLPSEELAGQELSSSPVRKSLSASITNFFRKMSPKSLRRLSRGSDKSKSVESPMSSGVDIDFESHGSPDSGSVGNENHVGTPHKHKGKSSKASPLKYLTGDTSKKSKEQKVALATSENKTDPALHAVINVASCDSQSSNVHASHQQMPSDTRRMLKSIEDNSHTVTEKSVYQAFKEKHPGKKLPEAATLKPQALRAVEFPDQVLHKENDEPDAEQVSPPATRPRTNMVGSSKADDLLVPPRHKPEVQRKVSEPPKSLNVREVAKLSTHMFQYPSMSYESIGPCSLAEAGSEPSLVSHSHRSSVTASKRTLNSQETAMSPAQRSHASSDVSNQSDGHAALPLVAETATSSLPSTSNDHSHMNDTSKTPSYLKLSCSVSGYNKYSTYTPKEPNRIKVIKVSEQNGSVSSSSSDVNDDHVVSRSDRCDQVNGSDSACLENRPINDRINGSPCPGNKRCEPITNGLLHEDDKIDGASTELVVNGRTEKCEDTDKYVTVATVRLNSRSSEEDALELKLDVKDEQRSKKDSPSTPSKDGHYFLGVLQKEEMRIQGMCHVAEQDLEGNLPEEASGKVRAAIGKANLLMSKKFVQFRGLCDKNITQTADDPYQTTPQDLAGFYDMMSLQVEDVEKMFAELDRLRAGGWQDVQKSPARSSVTGPKMKSPRSKDSPRTKELSKEKSQKAQEAAKAREEARKRLMAAKRKGRQRKASQSDKDGEIEIFA